MISIWSSTLSGSSYLYDEAYENMYILFNSLNIEPFICFIVTGFCIQLEQHIYPFLFFQSPNKGYVRIFLAMTLLIVVLK